MDNLIYVSTIGAQHIERAQAVHANNLANVNTVGFRADLAQARAVQVFGDGFPTRVYALTESPSINFDPGVPIETGRALDVMIEGTGYLAVQRADGQEAYTRGGNLQVDALGRLTTDRGRPVLGDTGPIVLPPFEQITIGADGSITVQPQGENPQSLVQPARLKLVNPEAGILTKGEDGLLVRNDFQTEASDPNVRVAPGFLEGSNVNAVGAMTEILSLARQFEIELKMMQNAEAMDQSATQLVEVN